MKIVCFPHYTCGGLLCDILNNTFSPVVNHGAIASLNHALGKIGDSDTVFENFDIDTAINKFKQTPSTRYIGTHCWPGNFPVDAFDKIINITTATERSRIYRWARAYNLYYLPRWSHLDGIELIDKTRETAKNYIIPFRPVFNNDCIYNLEFSEVVEQSAELVKVVEGRDLKKHVDRWQTINYFLYDPNFWNRPEVKAYYQAVYENELQKYYVYK